MKIVKQIGVKGNIALAMFSKIISLIASFLMIPLLLKSLGVEVYGLWVALSSVAAWLMLFDFGLGNSFKNSIASSDKDTLGKQYSLVFSFYLFVTVVLTTLFIFIMFMFSEEISNKIVLICLYLPLCVFFPLSLYSFALQGLRMVGINSLLETLRMLIWLLFAVYYVHFFNGEQLYVLALIFVSANLIPQIIQLIIFKYKTRMSLFPKLISLRKIIVEDSFKLGIRFFIIQLSSLISFNIGNVLILNNFSPSDVAVYDIMNKVFFAALSVFNMTIAVMWPEISKAYAEGNTAQCLRLYKVLLLLAVTFCFGLLIVTVNFSWLLKLLDVEKVIIVDSRLLWSIMILTSLQAIAYCGAVVLNATNKLTIQIWLAVASIALIFPLFKMMTFLNVGPASYPMATGILVLIAAVICNIAAVRLFESGK